MENSPEETCIPGGWSARRAVSRPRGPRAARFESEETSADRHHRRVAVDPLLRDDEVRLRRPRAVAIEHDPADPEEASIAMPEREHEVFLRVEPALHVGA